MGELNRYLQSPDESDSDIAGKPSHSPTADRANRADISPLEFAFEQHFTMVYGSDSARYLQREYAITDMDGHDRFIDYLIKTNKGLIGVEENGVNYHHPQVGGRDKYHIQLLKQNSCQRAGIKLFRFSSEDCRFADRFEDDIRSYFANRPRAS